MHRNSSSTLIRKPYLSVFLIQVVAYMFRATGAKLVAADLSSPGLSLPPPYPPPQAGEGRVGAGHSAPIIGMAGTRSAMTQVEPTRVLPQSYDCGRNFAC